MSKVLVEEKEIISKKNVSGGERAFKEPQAEEVLAMPEEVLEDKYVVFQWNGGRINNNYMAITAALALAKRLKRTVVVRPSPRDWNNAHYSYIGIFEGLWDIDLARQRGYQIVFEHDAPEDLVLDFPTMESGNMHCDTGGWGNENKRQGLVSLPPLDYLEECRVVYLRDPFLLSKMCKDAQESKKDFLPSLKLRDSFETEMHSLFDGGEPELALHARHHAWGDFKQHGSKFLCRGKWNIWGSHDRAHGEPYRSAVKRWTDDTNKQNLLLEMLELSCATSWEDLKLLTDYYMLGDPPAKFFLASDPEHLEHRNELVKNGGVMLEQKENLDFSSLGIDTSATTKHYDCSQWYCPTEKKIAGVIEVLADEWGLARAKFFVGSYASTLTNTVCWWRSLRRANNSNLCFLEERLDPGNNLELGGPIYVKDPVGTVSFGPRTFPE